MTLQLKKHFKRSDICYKIVYLLACMAMAFFLFKLIWSCSAVIYFSTRTNDEVKVIDTGNAFQVKLLSGYIKMSYLEFPAKILINPPEGKTLAITYIALTVITSYIPYSLIFIWLIMILGKVRGAETPFLIDIVPKIKNIGFTFLYIGVFSKLIYQIAISKIVFDKVFFNISIIWPETFFGLLLLLLCDIFIKGCELQQQVDETL